MPTRLMMGSKRKNSWQLIPEFEVNCFTFGSADAAIQQAIEGDISSFAILISSAK